MNHTFRGAAFRSPITRQPGQTTKLRAVRRTGFAFLIALLAGVASASAQNMPAGPWVGFWKFIPSKSTFPGPPPKIDQFTIDPDGTIHIHEMSAEGVVRDWYYTPKNNETVEVHGRGPNITVHVKKVNAHRIEHSWNFNGLTAASYSTLSKDGQIQTFHIKGNNKDGTTYEETAVYKKTPPEN
jgi:hypothetical protein